MPDPDDVPRWQHLMELSRAHPEARLNAVDDQGLFTPLPARLEALGHATLPGTSGIETVEHVDHDIAIQAWLEALEKGTAEVGLRDRLAPTEITRLHFIDLRGSAGVVAALAYEDGPRCDPARPDAAAEAPRVGRTRKDGAGTYLDVDPATERMLGYSRDAMVGQSARAFVHPEDQEPAVASWVAMLAQPGPAKCVRLRHRRGDGSWLWLDVANHNLLASPDVGCVLSDVVDVSQEMAFREDVRARERLLQRLTQALPVGLVQLDRAGQVVYTNERLHEVLGARATGSLEQQLGSLEQPGRDLLIAAFAHALRTCADHDLVVQVAGPVPRVCDVALRPVLDDQGAAEGVLGCFTDVTTSVQLQAELEHRATYDALTGCLNRAAVLRRLSDDLRRVHPAYGCAVLFLDLDGFKAVNDTRGHAAGDDVLRAVAAVLRSAARVGDAVGRLGGDEFVLVCPGVASSELALGLATDVRERLRRADPSSCGLTGASTGVAWTDDPAADPETVLAQADAAMYQAKQSGRTLPVLATSRQ